MNENIEWKIALNKGIVGAIVLIALAVIFLPAILKDKSDSGTFVSKIPAKPKELEEYQIDTKKIDDIMAKGNTRKQKAVLDASGSTEKVNKAKNSIKGNKTKENLTKIAQTTSNIVNSKTHKTKQSKSSNSDAKIVQKSKDSAQEQVKRKISDKFRDAAWIIQVASFSKEKKC